MTARVLSLLVVLVVVVAVGVLLGPLGMVAALALVALVVGYWRSGVRGLAHALPVALWLLLAGAVQLGNLRASVSEPVRLGALRLGVVAALVLVALVVGYWRSGVRWVVIAAAGWALVFLLAVAARCPVFVAACTPGVILGVLLGVRLVRGSLSDVSGAAVSALAVALLIVSPVMFVDSFCRAPILSYG